MKRPNLVLWRDVINELAHGLQIAIGFSAEVRRHTRMTADDAEQLEAAIGRAVNALRRLQPATPEKVVGQQGRCRRSQKPTDGS